MDYRVTLDADKNSKRGKLQIGKARTTFHALRGVSLYACEGEFVGLLGRNGSGKSTFLRVLAGLETPTSGTVMATAKPQLLGVSAALLPNLSGLENIRLGLLAMGMSPEEAEARRDRIVEFADIGDSIRMPMRTYSSGMGARLRFAISVAADPEIIMIDEALATGDAAFLERSQLAMRQLMTRSGTGFLVSHSAGTIESMCSRAVWMDQGQVVADGEPSEVLRQYQRFAKALAKGRPEGAAKIRREQREALEARNFLPGNH
ncbi:ABC transporter ATP-binding protein [Gulosibacter molinativorax]|uniref:ABC transporter ATP-binding protein n=2 Tax=Gulosibacter molinativorax TaxID=256821 RepID=A0ABT7C7B4_9MICO|nr:ABC transporter ATP-binding protein [Gulosibacter molinativorax]